MSWERYYRAVDYIHSLITGPPETAAPVDAEELNRKRLLRQKRVRYFLNLLGNPHQHFRSIHVGGTSGKGSVATFIASILDSAGFRTGLHTTPYLQTPIEKFQIGERYISPEGLADLIDWIKPYLEQDRRENPYGPPAHGETWVALTLAYLAREKVDFGVIEVGVGGRYDHTNVIEPLVAVITNIGLDHTKSLGETPAKIAYHKAGIVKDGIPVVTGTRQPEALAVIQEECRERGARLIHLGEEIGYREGPVDRHGGRFDYFGRESTYRDLHISLLGRHQLVNGVLAVAAVEALSHCGIRVPEAAIRQGLAKAFIPGRMEIIQHSPTVLLDGAHNPAKAQVLAAALTELFPDRRLILVVGMLGYKEAAGILSALVPLIEEEIIVTAPEVYMKAAADPEEVAAKIRGLGGKAICEPQSVQAVKLALERATPEDLICITGSLYLVGEVRSLWVSEEEILRTQTSRPSVSRSSNL